MALALTGCRGAGILGPLVAEGGWRLVTIETSGGAVDVSGLAPPATIRFASDPASPLSGMVGGFSACNQYSGRFTLRSGRRITFEAMATTLVACSSGAGEAQGALYQVLETESRLEIRADTLELDADGPVTLRFVAQ